MSIKDRHILSENKVVEKKKEMRSCLLNIVLNNCSFIPSLVALSLFVTPFCDVL